MSKRPGRWASGSPWMQRKVEAFGKKLQIGDKALFHGKGKTAGVKWVVQEYGYNERYVWKCLRLAEKLDKRMSYRQQSATSTAAPARKERPIYVAGRFLVFTLITKPKPANEIYALAREKGIALRTLHRASPRFVVKQRIGGRNGYWVWDLNEEQKNIFRPESQRLPKSTRPKRAGKH